MYITTFDDFYPKARMTKSQINKLGKKLRTASELDAETLSQLQQFRESCDEPMFGAQTLLSEADLETTSRLKTTNTIIEKLRRERMRLTEMQDIGGLRIVSKMDLSGQDTLVNRIVNIFPNTKVIDRRKTPSNGYRAVHVIVTFGERRVEIQVRTQLQDLWAQAMERIADMAGREFRYGRAAQGWSEDLDIMLTVAEVIAAYEQDLTELDQFPKYPQARRLSKGQHEIQLVQEEIRSFRIKVREKEELISKAFDSIFKAIAKLEDAPK